MRSLTRSAMPSQAKPCASRQHCHPMHRKTLMRLTAILALLALAACGAAGPPQAPKPGLTMTGEVAVGIGNNGTN